MFDRLLGAAEPMDGVAEAGVSFGVSRGGGKHLLVLGDRLVGPIEPMQRIAERGARRGVVRQDGHHFLVMAAASS